MNTYNKILENTYKLFLKKGLYNVSSEDISRASNISPGTLYYHFKNKDEIIELLHKKEFDIQDIHNLAWIVEFGKVKWPYRDLLLEGSEVNYFDGPYTTIRYKSKDLSIDISTGADASFEINITSKKVIQHKHSMHISEDTGILELVREVLTYPITEILNYLIEGENEDDKHVHVSSTSS